MRPNPRWDSVVDAWQCAAEISLHHPQITSDLARLEGIRYLTRLLGFGALTAIENHDPAYPHFTRLESPWMQWGLPNPDYVYWQAPLDGAYEYRITGARGTSRLLAVEVYEGDFCRLADMRVIASKSHKVDDGGGEFEVGPGGEIEIGLSRQEAAGNWLPLPAGGGAVMIRDIYYDWETETPSRLAIERVGATYPPPAPTAEDLEGRIQLLEELLRNTPLVLAKGIDQHYAQADTIPFAPLGISTNTIGFDQQYYGLGHYRCEPDEAVILEVVPPECWYWSFNLISQYWEACDWHCRQTHVNGHQAILDTDGAFRAVIAHADPGVPNWLDAAQHTVGLIRGTYNRTETVPVPTLRTVALDRLRDVLPAGTPVVTPAERSAAIGRRTHSIRRRLAD